MNGLDKINSRFYLVSLLSALLVAISVYFSNFFALSALILSEPLSLSLRSGESGGVISSYTPIFASLAGFPEGWRLLAAPDYSLWLVGRTNEQTISLSSYSLAVWDHCKGTVLVSVIPVMLFSGLLIYLRNRFNRRLEPLVGLANEALTIAELNPGGRNRFGGVGELVASLSMLRDKLNQQRDLFEKRAFQDHLTGLSGRQAFNEVLNRHTARAESKGEQFALLFIDLDGFKQINDTYGHNIGDELLIQVAERFKKAVRSSDIIAVMKEQQPMTSMLARLGGDEFTVLLTELKDIEDVSVVAQRILGTFDNEFCLSGKSVDINASIGIALYPDSATTPGDLLQMADIAMYQAKADGKGTFRVFASEMGNEVRRRHYLSREMHAALEKGGFSLQFQPIIQMDSCFIEFFEALLRWEHPDAGWIEPSEFIPVAEEKGVINHIGEWVLEEACQQMAIWYNAGMTRVGMSVNISAIQLKQRDVYTWVMGHLNDVGLPPRCLMLEITETCLLQVSDEVLTSLQRLREEGVRIAIDDFGTGFSSLNMLAMLPVDVLKIDQSFITQALTSPKHRDILDTIMELSIKLELLVVAEGVEKEEEFSLLKELHCRCIQGYLVSRPQTPVAVKDKLIEEGYKQLAHSGSGLWLPRAG